MRVAGLAHAVNAAWSRLHSKACTPRLSVAVKLNVTAFERVVPFFGISLPFPSTADVIVVSGGESTDQVWSAGVPSRFDDVSTAFTAKSCRPTARAPRVHGLEHDVNAAPSRLHSKPATATLSVPAKVMVATFDKVAVPCPSGVPLPSATEVTDVSGGAVSTAKERLAGLVSRFPAVSIARTSKVCEPSLSVKAV